MYMYMYSEELCFGSVDEFRDAELTQGVLSSLVLGYWSAEALNSCLAS